MPTMPPNPGITPKAKPSNTPPPRNTNLDGSRIVSIASRATVSILGSMVTDFNYVDEKAGI